MTVNYSEMCIRWKEKLGQYRRYQSWDSLDEYRLKRKGRVKEMLKDKTHTSLKYEKEWRDEQPDVDEKEDCPINQQQIDSKIYLLF